MTDGLKFYEENEVMVTSMDELETKEKREFIHIICSVISYFADVPVSTMILFDSSEDLQLWSYDTRAFSVRYIPSAFFYLPFDIYFTDDENGPPIIAVFDCEDTNASVHVVYPEGNYYTDYDFGYTDQDIIRSFYKMIMQQLHPSSEIAQALINDLINRLGVVINHLKNGQEHVSLTFNSSDQSVRMNFSRKRMLEIQRRWVTDQLREIVNDNEGPISPRLYVALYGSGELYDMIKEILQVSPVVKFVTIVERTRYSGDDVLNDIIRENILTDFYPVDDLPSSFFYDIHAPVSTPLHYKTIESAHGTTLLDQDTQDGRTTIALTRLKHQAWSGPTILMSLQAGHSLDHLSATLSRYVPGVVPVSFYEDIPASQEENYVWIGHYEAGQRHGEGEVVYLNQPVCYRSEFFMDERTGYGEVLHFGQREWSGAYLSDYPEGYGSSWDLATCSAYLGEFSSGEQHGIGCELHEGSEYFYGQFQNDMIKGRGVASHEDGSISDGYYHGRSIQGRGFSLQANGSVVFGTWHDGILDGIGEVYDVDGEYEYGMHTNEELCGYGCVVTREGMEQGWYMGDCLVKEVTLEEEVSELMRLCYDKYVVDAILREQAIYNDDEENKEGDEGEGKHGDKGDEGKHEGEGGEGEGIHEEKDDDKGEEGESMYDTNDLDFFLEYAQDYSEEAIQESNWIAIVQERFSTPQALDVIDSILQNDFSILTAGKQPTIFGQTINSSSEYVTQTVTSFVEDWAEEENGGMVSTGQRNGNHFSIEKIKEVDETHYLGRVLYKKEKVVYEGEFQGTQFCGKGVVYYPNGNKKYEGEFRNSVPHGRCTSYFSNGCLEYDGTWVDGIKEGTGSQYRKVNLEYCNAAGREYMMKKASSMGGKSTGSGNYISFANGFDMFSLSSYRKE